MGSRKMCETTEAERKIILNLNKHGKSYAEIGKIVNRSRYTICSIVKRFKFELTVTNARSGRPRIITGRARTTILRKIKKQPKLTSMEIAQEVINLNCHPKTVRRVLHKAGYHARVARRKPLISSNNKIKMAKCWYGGNKTQSTIVKI